MAAGLTGYESLARYYDVLMADVPYRRWIKFIDSFARRAGREGRAFWMPAAAQALWPWGWPEGPPGYCL